MGRCGVGGERLTTSRGENGRRPLRIYFLTIIPLYLIGIISGFAILTPSFVNA